MSAAKMTPEDLIELFRTKATTPPPKASQMLVRHLQCKKSVQIAQHLANALDRHAAADSQPLPVPAELLPPLG
jgi:hypothetical protein